MASTIALVAAGPLSAQVALITGVRLNPTPTGVEVVLETLAGGTPEVLTSQDGETFIADIVNAQLRLPGGENFLADNPIEGISAIAVTAVEGNQVRVTVTGATAVPVTDFVVENGQIGFRVTPSAETVTLPPPPTTETSPETESQTVPADAESTETSPETESQTVPADADIIELIVTATRIAEQITDVPASISVVGEEKIAEQTRLTRDLGTILSQEVPGLSVGTQSASTFGQTLRGRNISVIIDGVPQSTNRNAARDLRTIDPSAIERVEVLRGPTAIYGDGATGGVINIITKRGRGEGLQAETTVDLNAFPTNVGETFGQNIQQSFSGNFDNFDFALNGSFSNSGAQFDAQGDRIPPDPNGQGGLSDTTTLNLLSKVGFNFTDSQRIQLTLNYFRDNQDTDYTSDPIVNTIPGRQQSRTRRGLDLDESQKTETLNASLDYSHNDILGSSVQGQIYYRDYFTRFFPFDARTFANLGNTIFQSRVESEKYGARLQIDTPIVDAERANLLWGVDLVRENTEQPVSIFDPVAFDNSNGLVYDKTGNRTWAPLQRQNNIGLFGQLKWNVSDRLVLRGGVRHERITVDVNDYTTLAGNSIEGGELDYNATVFNVGGVVYPTERISLFAGFSQGFSIADVGFVLRSAPAGFTVEQLNPEAQKVNNYEIGIRGNYARVQASLAGFYNTSNLGTSFNQENYEIVRAPERVYGVEFALDAQPSDAWALGTSFTWSEGGADFNEDDDYESPLNGFRISPIKITAYLENESLPGWRNRLQALYSGTRNPTGQSFGLGEVESYFTLDFISSLNIGRGRLVLGVENLLNTEYFPVVSQLQGLDTGYTAARGRSIRLGYSFSW
ncbi:TonB-dependent receptor domain-containing protein [Laspinema olomoucense]|uniref:TonB-dependent receptor domain-containing protein n=1 Tax=Laspinema olomoucense TaxID=3231600 RepID=UPI0021BB4E94|nr:TonB-dependent receptor [Laspinema sp. D3d]MCT7972758.1 TonB-dependent receptor [Laspinema sp. D3d]